MKCSDKQFPAKIALSLIVAISFNVNIASGQDTIAPAPPQGLRIGIGATLYNDPTKNIFDTFDPLCNPATAAANGVMFCDGFEDGKWVDSQANLCDVPANCGCWGAQNAAPGNDGWAADSGAYYQGGPVPNVYDCFEARTLGKQFSWGHIRPGNTIYRSRSNFGAAGTPGTASTNWIGFSRTSRGQKGMAASRNISISGGNPQNTGPGARHFYGRYYFKETGTGSLLCDCNGPGGFDCDRTTPPSPTCPAYADDHGNGIKGVEQIPDDTTTGGIEGVIDGRHFWNSPFNAGIGGPCTNAGTTTSVNRNLPPLLSHVNVERWYYFEWEVDFGTTARNDGVFRVWHNDCGVDGLDCGPGTSNPTPTLRSEFTGIDMYNNCAGGATMKAIWVNYWTGNNTIPTVNGERQFDEFVYVDATAGGRGYNNPIGFAPNMSGVTSAP